MYEKYMYITSKVLLTLIKVLKKIHINPYNLGKNIKNIFVLVGPISHNASKYSHHSSSSIFTVISIVCFACQVVLIRASLPGHFALIYLIGDSTVSNLF